MIAAECRGTLALCCHQPHDSDDKAGRPGPEPMGTSYVKRDLFQPQNLHFFTLSPHHGKTRTQGRSVGWCISFTAQTNGREFGALQLASMMDIPPKPKLGSE